MNQILHRLFVLFIVMGISIGAWSYDFAVDGIYYNILTDSTVSVTYATTSYNSYSGDIVIPNALEYNSKKYKVTTVGVSAFRGCTALTNISIPKNITTVGDYSFFGCTELTSIDIPNSVTSLGIYAFGRCI